MPMLRQENGNTLVDRGAPQTPASALAAWSQYAGSSYLIGERIAAGGMGTVHLGLKQGALGFRRLLAIKRLHVHLAGEPDFVARFKDEIRLVSRLNHPNVVQTLDVVESANELALVMEFVEGVTLHQLMKDARAAQTDLPVALAVGVVAQALHGLHSAHELVDDEGRLLHLVHRDVSPQNVMIARDGLVKVLDFGVAKATSETHVTRTGQLSGKAPYMSPEQIWGSTVDRRTDVFAAGVVLWEALTGQRLFRQPGTAESSALRNVLELRIRPPSELRPEVSPTLERIVLRALEREPARRFGSARDFALALEEAVPEASVSTVVNGVMEICGARLAEGQNARHLLRVPEHDGFRATSSPAPALAPASRGSGDAAMLSGDPATRVAAAWGHVSSDATTMPAHCRPAEAELQTSDVQGVPMDASVRTRARGRALFLTGVLLAVAASVGALVFQDDGRNRTELTEASSAGRSAKGAPDADQETEAAARSAGVVGAEASRVHLAPPSEEAPTAGVKERVESGRPASSPLQPASSGAERPKLAHGKTTPSNANGRLSAGPRVVEKGPPPKPTPAPCSPPTYTDAEGIRHFKPECL